MRHSSYLGPVSAILLGSAITLIAACESDGGTTPGTINLDAGSLNVDGNTPITTNDASPLTDATITPPDGGPPVAPLPSEECMTFAGAYCDVITRCYPVLIGGIGNDVPTCTARAAIACAIAEASPGAAKPVDSCSAKLKAATCADNLTNLDPSCHAQGVGAADGVCEYDGQCQSGACIKPTAGQPCGTCKPRAVAGDACTNAGGATIAECDYGLQCADGKCVAPGALGDGCTKGTCQPPNRCQNNPLSAAQTGKCVAAKAINATCTSGGAFDADPCNVDQGEYCKTSPLTVGGTCTAITYAATGEACGVVNGALVGCVGLGTCFNSKCVANAADNAACNTTSGPACSGPAECTNGVCTFPSPSRCK